MTIKYFDRSMMAGKYAVCGQTTSVEKIVFLIENDCFYLIKNDLINLLFAFLDIYIYYILSLMKYNKNILI